MLEGLENNSRESEMDVEKQDLEDLLEEESECISQIQNPDLQKVNEGPAFKAVRANDIPRLSAILFTGCDINATNENEDFPEKNIFYEILDWHRMVRVVRLKGYTVLHLAVVHSNIKMIKYLLSKGADVNASDINLMSPLSLAAAVQRLDVIRILIKAGAVIDSQSVSGRTPLIQAIGTNNLSIVRQLLKAGANPDLTDTKGSTPLLMCLQARRDDTENLKILKAIIDAGCQVDLPNKQGATALMVAVGIGRLDAADVLLRAGANINLRDKADQSTMHFATGATTVLHLLHNGATSDWPDKKGITPLEKAARVGHISLMTLFMESDSNRNMSLLDLPRVIQARQQVPLFDQWLQKEFGSPRTLRRHCRQVIRHCMSPSNTAYITNLPVPQMVKDFLLCKHLNLPFYRSQTLRLGTVPTLHP